MMQRMIRLKIERLQENNQEYFLATSDDIKGLLAEGNTLAEVVEIAQDIAQNLIEMDRQQAEYKAELHPFPTTFEYPILVEV
jgi:predicted RNase H-like HicB family nuclease